MINAQSRVCRGVLGVVDATQVFYTCADLLELPVPGGGAISACTQASAPSSAGQPGSQYTVDEGPGVREMVEDHIHRIVGALESAVPDLNAVILTGSFGRGEGGIEWKDGRPRPVNDYDLLVVALAADRLQLGVLGNALAREIGIDYVDIGVVRADELPKLGPTMFTFDLRYGSRVVHGDPALLEAVPRYASAAIPLNEGLTLLFNRVAGLLLGLPGSVVASLRPLGHDRTFLLNQIVKAMLAIGDWYLLFWKAYTVSYRVRRTRFETLGRAAGVDGGILAAVDWAYGMKLRPDYERPVDLSDLVPKVLSCLERTISAAARQLTPGSHGLGEATGLADALERWFGTLEPVSRPVGALRVAMVLALLSVKGPGQVDRGLLTSARGWLGRSDAQGVCASEHGDDALREYALVRDRLVELWEERCH